MGTDPGLVREALAEAHRREWAAVLAATVRVTRDLDLAEECAQDAFVTALEAWERDGIPRSPGAWLTTAARRKALDAIRRASTLRSKLPLLVVPEASDDPGDGLGEGLGGDPAGEIADDRLRLVFTCCHPALAREAQAALTLRLVCGLTTAEIARAFLVSEATMAARVTRAKRKIAAARIPYRVPGAHELPERLDAVLTVVHLVLTTGHTAPSGDALVRDDLVARAIDLGRVLLGLMPDEGEVRGLLALMLLTDARRATRVDPQGDLVLLEDQDRSRWDREAIAEGRALVTAALRGGRPGRFTLQAAIAATHADARTWAETDWVQIVALYDLLLLTWPSPVVALNRAAALAMRDGAEVGLVALGALDASALAGYHYLPAARADLLRRLGRREEAASAYREALALVDNTTERTFLQRRLAEVTT